MNPRPGNTFLGGFDTIKTVTAADEDRAIVSNLITQHAPEDTNMLHDMLGLDRPGRE